MAWADQLARVSTDLKIGRCPAMFLYFKRYTPFLAITAILVLSLIPGQFQVRTGASRHLEHFAAYFAVAGVLALAWGKAPLKLFCVGVLLMGLAATMEIAQVLVPGRTARLSDLAASDLGVASGLVAMWILLRLLPLMNRAMAPRPRAKP